MPDPVTTAAWRWCDAALLAFAALAVIGSGLGLRDPWPADEPRFVLLARDMIASGNWLIPVIGGDLYPDKPPLFFWSLAASYALFGSLRWSFLLPALVSAVATLWLVYDLARRLSGRYAAIATAITLLVTLQFTTTMRGAQIDPLLCALMTLSVYALSRHLIFGPAWGWYFVGGVAAGLGVITKGVGFLPILMVFPYIWLRRRGFRGLYAGTGNVGLWLLAPLGMLLAITSWLVPVLVAAMVSPDIAAYRDEILFKQTVGRYASAWHHNRPWYYFLVEVVPGLWLPFSLLLFWLVPAWYRSWCDGNGRVALLLSYLLICFLFFSLSSGKRGVYLLPLLPVLAVIAAAPLETVLLRRALSRWSLALAGILVAAMLVLFAAAQLQLPMLQDVLGEAGIANTRPLLYFGITALLAVALLSRSRGYLAWPVVFAMFCVMFGIGIAPLMNGERSGRDFVAGALRAIPDNYDIGLVAYKEQFLLYLDRPAWNFGHRRWREGNAEADDAAAWLAAGQRRLLLVPDSLLRPCFPGARLVRAGHSASESWWWVTGVASAPCVARGSLTHALYYDPAKPGHRAP
ncbi:MAG: glycosyltransferase family 39 protein [Steroidobacteraceae bacterium]